MQQITTALDNFRRAQATHDKLYKPVFYRLSDSTCHSEFFELLKKENIQVKDYILDQLYELIKVKNPSKKYTKEELHAEVFSILAGSSTDLYGVWVYYPWSNRLVHILDEEEFVHIRTSRNQNKITASEQAELRKKSIGVIGLSVGQSVSVTLAMERICGELRLADFDLLELTNLNRIRTGIHNLGLPKVYSVAREIAEIDPFIRVKCFPEGLHENNMEEFFLDGGKLDLLVEESDGFDIKIIARHKARELGVPVVMEASDRCMVDVERFDLEPNRPILHGLVDHLDIDTLKSLKTTEEKIPYMLDVLGLNTSSLRLKASMMEIEQSINTWPQLASAVTMGGGIAADVTRRILLGQYNSSGRYHIDIDELICDPKPEEEKISDLPNHPPIPAIEQLIPVVPVSISGEPLEKEVVESLVTAACLAPSGGNLQPWRWIYSNGALHLFNVLDGKNAMLGYGNYASFVALGAALENLTIEATSIGLTPEVTWFPNPSYTDLAASVVFKKHQQLLPNLSLLKPAIGIRLTNRKLSEPISIEPSKLEKLSLSAAETPGCDLRFITDRTQIEAIADVLGEIEKVRILEELGHRDFVQEICWTKEENDARKDGVDIRTLDITNTEKVGLEVGKDPKIIEKLREWNGGGAFKKLTKKSVASSGAIGIISMNSDQPLDYLHGGMAIERTWLLANAFGIAYQPIASSLFIYDRLIKGKGSLLSEKGIEKLWNLRPNFEKVLGLDSARKDIFIFRLCTAEEPEIKSLRKPLNKVLHFHTIDEKTKVQSVSSY